MHKASQGTGWYQGSTLHMTRMLSTMLRVSFLLMSTTVATALRAQTLEHTHTYTWDSEAVVGLSAIEVEDNGRDFHAIGDRGWYLRGQFNRSDGAIQGVDLIDYLPILGQNGWPVSARRVGDWSDAEGLAIAPDNSMWISFERWTRVIRYSGPEDSGRLIPPHPTFKDYADNRQLESLALHPDGTLYAFAEAPLAEGFAVYRLQDQTWDIAGYIAQGNRYAIVGADFDAQGQLYLLERRHLFGKWWQSRIRSLDLQALDAVNILWTSRWGAFDNLEGIAVWQDGPTTHLTVVSDNNGMKPGQTQFLEFKVAAD